MERTGYAYLLAAAFFFSVMTVCVKLAGERLPAEEIIVARAVFGLVLSLATAGRNGSYFGLPLVDEVLNRYRERVPVVA